jgi:hypothetical protein
MPLISGFRSASPSELFFHGPCEFLLGIWPADGAGRMSNWYPDVGSVPALLFDARGPKSTGGCELASDLLRDAAIVLLVVYADTGLLPLDLVLSGTGASNVSILRTGAWVAGVVLASVGEAGAETTASSSISSILRTGERGVYGEEERMCSGGLAF